MFDEMWSGACDVCVWGPGSPEEIPVRAIPAPLFSASIAEVSSIRFVTIDALVEIDGLSITSFAIHHPQGAVGSRIDRPRRSVAIVTDHEAGTDIDADVLDAIAGVDFLIHDAQYLPGELAVLEGWGHSSHEDATGSARAGSVGELVLTSHDPRRSDVAIDAVIESAKEPFLETVAARAGMEASL